MLAENDRFADLADIERAYRALFDQARGRAHAAVRLAAPLAQEEMDMLIGVFRRLTGKTVIPAVALDPELLGGVVVEIEGRVYDASLKTQLHRLGEALARQL